MTLDIAVNPEPWIAQARCADGTYDPDDFFPHSLTNITDVIGCCEACPVKAACTDYALRTDQDYGIWGGLTELERRALKRGMPVKRRTWSSPVPQSQRTRQRLRRLRSLSANSPAYGGGGGR